MTVSRYLQLCVILFLTLPACVYGQASKLLLLQKGDMKKALVGKLVYLEDNTNRMTVQEVAGKMPTQSKTLPTNQANFYQSNSTFWFKFEIKHPAFAQEDWLVEVPYPPLDYVDFHYQDAQGRWQIERSGDRLSFRQKSIKTKINAFKLIFHSDSIHTFYVSVKTNGILQIPFNFQESYTFFIDLGYEEAFLGIFYGMLLALGLYNLFLFFVLSDIAYLWYSVYMFCSVVFTASLIGHTFQYLFFDAPFLIEPVLVFSGCFLIFTVCSFIQSFLGTKENIPRGHLALKIVKAVAILNILAFFVFGYTVSTRLLNVLSPFTVLSIITISIYATVKRIPAAQFLSLAFLSMVIGTTVYALMQLSYLPHSLFTVHAPRFGLSFQGLLFSLALADRYRALRRQLLQQEKEENEKLENRVKERTEALEDSNKVLAHQNSQIQQSIQAAKVIQKAILPHQEKREALLQDYFVIYRPRDVVSGDFYWLNKIGENTFLAVIDCTGHGVPGAFMTLITNNLLDKIVRVWDMQDPAKILARLHEEVQLMLHQKETDNSYGMDMSFMVITPQQTHTQIVFAGAKQKAYYMLPAEPKIQTLAGNRKSIGGTHTAEADFQNYTLALPKGSKIYLTTDGYLDQNDVKRKKIGEKQFIQLLEQVGSEDMTFQKQTLIKYLYNFMKDTEQRDDILVIGINII